MRSFRLSKVELGLERDGCTPIGRSVVHAKLRHMRACSGFGPFGVPQVCLAKRPGAGNEFSSFSGGISTRSPYADVHGAPCEPNDTDMANASVNLGRPSHVGQLPAVHPDAGLDQVHADATLNTAPGRNYRPFSPAEIFFNRSSKIGYSHHSSTVHEVVPCVGKK